MILFDIAKDRNNNFKLISLCAVFLVLLSHSFPLALGREHVLGLVPFAKITYGSFAVDVLFIISGFLVTRAYYSKSSIKSFLWARVLRIYPGIVVAILLIVFILAPLLSSIELDQLFSQGETWRFLRKNVLLNSSIVYQIPGVFSENPYPNAVVSSIWTLPHQLKAYLYLTVFLLC